MTTNYIFDGQFRGNVLVLGRTECGKTSFVQRLALYDFFGTLKNAKWVSGIKLRASREAEIESNFSCDVTFYYPNDVNDLVDLLEEFKLEVETDKTTNENQNATVFGEKIERDRLIVFDDISGLADNSTKFVNFLTVARKYKYNCVYIFHTIYPEKLTWKTILSQTNIFNIFPASVSLNSVKRILDGSCVRKTTKNIPRSLLWINRLFIELANKNQKVCLTLDCSNTNRDGPSRFRSNADNPDKQVCYFNLPTDEQVYNEFIARRLKSKEFKNNIYFEITEVKSKTKNVFFNVSTQIENLVNENGSSSCRFSDSTISRATAASAAGAGARRTFAGARRTFAGRESRTFKADERTKPRYLFGR